MIKELHFAMASITNSTGQEPGRPRLDSAADENWSLECMGWDLSQEIRQSPSRMSAMKKESVTPLIAQL